jgi:hypothetical protein
VSVCILAAYADTSIRNMSIFINIVHHISMFKPLYMSALRRGNYIHHKSTQKKLHIALPMRREQNGSKTTIFASSRN